MPEIGYGFGNSPIASDTEHNISIHVFTDLPIWNFRVYNDISIWNATKMLRIMFTEPTIIDLREPYKNIWDVNTIDLVSLDKLISINWEFMISAYNNELDDNMIQIPENLKKPDYTKLVNPSFRESVYFAKY